VETDPPILKLFALLIAVGVAGLFSVCWAFVVSWAGWPGAVLGASPDVPRQSRRWRTSVLICAGGQSYATLTASAVLLVSLKFQVGHSPKLLSLETWLTWVVCILPLVWAGFFFAPEKLISEWRTRNPRDLLVASMHADQLMQAGLREELRMKGLSEAEVENTRLQIALGAAPDGAGKSAKQLNKDAIQWTSLFLAAPIQTVGFVCLVTWPQLVRVGWGSLPDWIASHLK
jgi:hypothetical protein